VVNRAAIARAVGEVLDPHLPVGLRELGMLETVEVADDGSVSVVVNMPCHHCPGLQLLRDDIAARARAAGAHGHVRVSFHGREAWKPLHISERARAALRDYGIQVAAADDQEGTHS
jgi:metal-sulfur cluster biosynthetic enzyme